MTRRSISSRGPRAARRGWYALFLLFDSCITLFFFYFIRACGNARAYAHKCMHTSQFPLFIAKGMGMTDLLLKYGADPNMQSQSQPCSTQRFTASLRAVRGIGSGVASLLNAYDKLNYVKARPGTLATPLLYAAQCLDLPKVVRLIEVGWRTYCDVGGKWIGHAHHTGTCTTRIPTQARCEVNTMDDHGSNALLTAASRAFQSKDAQERTLARMVPLSCLT